jgi:hypothetical protein
MGSVVVFITFVLCALWFQFTAIFGDDDDDDDNI